VTARVVPDSSLRHLAVVAHARLVVIGGDTEAIRARFADPQPRMFPVAVTFLVPNRLI